MKKPLTISPLNILGELVDTIPVQLSTRFLEHFSEQLYSSPQKAFEELISNGWDAGANIVDVQIAPDLKEKGATMAVLDNGVSMDKNGLRTLWHIAFSPKLSKPTHQGRPVIGKFGIGKLATYVLAKKLTYICKADDGKIRQVTMNYGDIDQHDNSTSLINDLMLGVYEITQTHVADILETVNGGEELLKLINDNFQVSTKCTKLVNGVDSEDEFGGIPTKLVQTDGKTWTLVVLSDLKPVGQALKVGILRRMLEAALPFGSEMSIYINDDLLKSQKIDTPVMEQWRIGPSLGIKEIEIGKKDILDVEGTENEVAGWADNGPMRAPILVTSGEDPDPYIEIPGLGRITGLVRLFKDRISGGKSEQRGASNGFHVNVLGRIVNQSDPSFGEKNLSHAAWARFRMAVRVDSLNKYLTTNREQFQERHELVLFRAFLRKVFNKARNTYDSDPRATLSDGGDVLVKSLGVLSLNPLRSVVSETLRDQAALPDLFDETGIEDREAKRQSWWDNTADNIRRTLHQVAFGGYTDHSFAKFRINDSTIVVNKDHPFVMEHSRRKAEKELVRTMAMVTLLSDIYALDIGVDPNMLANLRAYRDKLLRHQAMRRRQSGKHIASLLLQTQHESEFSKRFEVVVSDALSYLGFEVKDLGKPGEPEGIASAYPLPTESIPTDNNPAPPLYRFTFDAKTSKYEVAKTGNLHFDAAFEHRKRYEADHTLIIAPGYSAGALETRCIQQEVTPMTGYDLGQLLMYTVKYGAISVIKFREVLTIYEPKRVSQWVIALGEELRSKRILTLDVFLAALDKLKYEVPDKLAAPLISHTCRTRLGVPSVVDEDIIRLVRGLEIIVPDLIGITGQEVVVTVSAERLADAVRLQLEELDAKADEDIDSVQLP